MSTAPNDTRALVRSALAGDDGARRALTGRIVQDDTALVAILTEVATAERERLAAGLLEIALARYAADRDPGLGIATGFERAGEALANGADLHAEAQRIRRTRMAAVPAVDDSDAARGRGQGGR